MFLVPVANTAHIRRRPWMTLALIAVNAAIWLSTAFTPGPKTALRQYERVLGELQQRHGRPFEDKGLFEARLVLGLVVSEHSAEARAFREARREAEAALEGLDSWLTQKLGFIPERGFDHRLFASLFLHGDFQHLFMNMLFLFLVGCNIEDQWGRWRFLGFFLAGGVVANFVHYLAEPRGDLPLVGASGAVSAVMGAFVIFHAWTKIRFFWWFIVFGFFEVPAVAAIAAWFLLQIVSAASSSATVVAYWAHIGGFGFGLLLALGVRIVRGVPAASARVLPSRDESQVALPGAALLGGDWAAERALDDAEKRLSAGDAEPAASLFAGVLERSPGNVQARWGLVRALRTLGRRREATRIGESLMADLAAQGRNDEARRVYSLLMT